MSDQQPLTDQRETIQDLGLKCASCETPGSVNNLTVRPDIGYLCGRCANTYDAKRQEAQQPGRHPYLR